VKDATSIIYRVRRTVDRSGDLHRTSRSRVGMAQRISIEEYNKSDERLMGQEQITLVVEACVEDQE
jgi:hypothetical protein